MAVCVLAGTDLPPCLPPQIRPRVCSPPQIRSPHARHGAPPPPSLSLHPSFDPPFPARRCRRRREGKMMAKSATAGPIATILSNPAPDSSAAVSELVVQIVDLWPISTSTTRFTFMANDGKMKLKAMLPTHFASEIHSEKLQNLGSFGYLTTVAIPYQTKPKRL